MNENTIFENEGFEDDEEDDGLGIFIGTKSTYEKLMKEKHNIDVDLSKEDEENSEKPNKPKKNTTVLSKETLKELDEESMKILKRARTVHDYEEVFMQSSLDFYDEFYNNENVSEELKAVRNIRRAYKVYSDYIDAMNARNAYIDSLVEKYGGEAEFNKKLAYGMIKDWIPRVPVLSKKCPEYSLYLSGMLPNQCETLPEGTSKKVLKAMQDELEELGIETEMSYDVETNIGVINRYNAMLDEEYANYGIDRRNKNTVTVSDLNQLNDIFRSWYKPDGNGEPTQELFRNAPSKIRERFENECAFNEPGLLSKMVNEGYVPEEPEPDLNELVYDEVTGRRMTRKELGDRERIRLLASFGTWSEARLLHYNRVGETLVNKARVKKPKRTGRRKRQFDYDDEFVDENMNSPTGTDPTYSDNESLADAFMRLMRGD